MTRARPVGLAGLTEGFGFYSKHACGHTQGRAQHTTAVQKILAESGQAYCRPSSAFGASGPSYLPLEAPGCREFRPVCAFPRQLEQCEAAWNRRMHPGTKALSPAQLSSVSLSRAGVLGQLLPASSLNPGRMTERRPLSWTEEPELLALPARLPTTHTFPLDSFRLDGGLFHYDRTPSMKQRVFQTHLAMMTLHQARPRKGGMSADRASVSPSVKWTGKAPNPTLVSSAGGLPHPGVPEYRMRCPLLLTTAGPRYCFDLSPLGRPGATSLTAVKPQHGGCDLLSAAG